MFNMFNRRREKEMEMGQTNLEEYKVLVTGPDSQSFLEGDTVAVFILRDEIEKELSVQPTNYDVTILTQLDDALKEKILISKAYYLERIASNDAASEYLRGVLLDLQGYGKDEPSSKWWYHLLDDVAV